MNPPSKLKKRMITIPFAITFPIIFGIVQLFKWKKDANLKEGCI